MFEPDLFGPLVKSGNSLLDTFAVRGGTTALAQIISEGAQGFGPESGDLRAVLDDLDTVVTGYAGQTQTIDTLLNNLSTFVSGLGPDAEANAQALTNLANTTEVLDRQKDRLVQEFAALLNSVSTQGLNSSNADLTEITDQLSAVNTVTKGVANQQVALGKVLQFLNGHNESTARGVDHNDDFIQVLNDFIICGLGQAVGDPGQPGQLVLGGQPMIQRRVIINLFVFFGLTALLIVYGYFSLIHNPLNRPTTFFLDQLLHR